MTRWTKVYRDLWNNRSRTGLVILSIAAGVFAIGMILTSQLALSSSLDAQYAAVQPADAILLTEPALDQDFVRSLRHLRGVAAAEGRRALVLRISLDGRGETWRDLTLYALNDYDDQQLFVVRPQDGNWPPEKGQVLMERASMAYIGVRPGQEILVRTPAGRRFRLEVTGRAHDLARIPPIIEGWIYGYVSRDTIRWMGEAEGFNELFLSVDDPAVLRDVADRATRRIEGLGLPVYQTTLPRPGEHPLAFIIDTVTLLLSLLALLAMSLSALLVTNVISALIVQQERQIGIMKAIGGRADQVMGLYFGMVLILGSLACLIAVPLGLLSATALSAFVAELLNFDPPPIGLTIPTALLQLAAGLLVPVLAATPAILGGTRLSPARVLSEYGINQVWGGAGLLDRLLAHFPRLTRDRLLALRNPFRQRGRLILSLTTLTFAGAVFMAVVNLQASLDQSLNDMFAFWRYDSWLIVDGHVPAARLVDEALQVPGVAGAEAWGFSIGRYVRPDGTESDNLYLLAPPAGTDLLNPPIIAGRRLSPGEHDGILISPGLLANEPSLQLGSRMTVKIEGHEQDYTVVGVMNMLGNATIGYVTVMDYTGFTRHVYEPNRANAVILTYAAASLDEQRAVSSAVENRFDRADIEVLSNFLIAEEREEIDAAFGVVVALLMIMTLLLATVGGLGLMGTMGLNVLERTREIGVMRAYGASSTAIFRIVIIEGLIIGLISWGLALVLAVPLSMVLAHTIGLSFMDYPMAASYAPGGVVAWAALVIVISILASLFPAWRAVRLTVTEVLAYE